ncbi:DUF2291 family protein [Kushneria phyllosphaerae]|uniref:Lipoprotein n=1 Tax=Kushneria phyllosphaerae TaxID=2100822 RepID=A0A2R8CGK5_9GAMM|nr:DUF2291 domain-containing protein [Kushneria phyllosphaerae]SPJ32028.1 hypothetical protein KSP9073_00028 [Kushneria phyllosphaerae]
MTADASTHARPRSRKKKSRAITAVVVVVVAAAMAWDTHVVEQGAQSDVQSGQFSAERYGQEQFPEIMQNVESRAVEAPELAQALNDDASAAGERYGVASGIAPIFPVHFTGTVGEGKSGIYTIDIPDMPEGTRIRVQTGPAINGTTLRDATGDISFGQFTNQIEYQDAGAAINNAMKAEVLEGVDTAALSGKTVEVTGVFQMINPKNWLVTPVALDVQ